MKTLLVVEDEASLMRLMRAMLKEYSLLVSPNAEEADQQFTENSSEVDLLIADVTLPNISGVQLAVNLRDRKPALPVILTSGYPVSGWNERDAWGFEKLQSHAIVVLQKPFHRETLLAAVQKLTGGPSEMARPA